MELVTIEEKETIVNLFVKKLIDKEIINIYDDRMNLDENKIFTIECCKEIFNEIGFVKGIWQEYAE